MTKDALDKAITDGGIEIEQQHFDSYVKCTVTDQTVTVGKTEVNRYKTNSRSKVPDITFYDVPQHLALLEWLIQDFTLGEHLLLVGNQGSNKKKSFTVCI